MAGTNPPLTSPIALTALMNLTVPPQSLHQCILVTMSGTNINFLNDAIYQNMNFDGASLLQREADISLVGLKAFSPAPRDVYLAIEKLNMPPQGRADEGQFQGRSDRVFLGGREHQQGIRAQRRRSRRGRRGRHRFRRLGHRAPSRGPLAENDAAVAQVYADETRPFLQGARLTAWELMKDGIDTTVITDNMAGAMMRLGNVDLVVVGADRIAANGDVANKVGTYPLAILAKEHKIPFYVAAPTSTIEYRGLKINHAEYLSYGASCESCHNGVTEKPRPIRSDACFSCHEFGLERHKARAEVVIDVELLEVNRARAKELGLNLSQYQVGAIFSPEGAPGGSTPPAARPATPRARRARGSRCRRPSASRRRTHARTRARSPPRHWAPASGSPRA